MSEATLEAQIIPFPGRPSLPPSPQDMERKQLHASLARLLSALEGQKAAVQEWRASIGHLHKTVQKLGVNMENYRGTLSGLANNVAGLRAKSLETVRILETAKAMR